MRARTVNLVATLPTIQRYFSGVVDSKSGVMSADFPISPQSCRTALGRWLAETILTTRFDDDASQCRILLPATEQGLHFRELAERLLSEQEIRSLEEAERRFAALEAWIKRQRQLAKVYGRTTCEYRTFLYQWPVFGSVAVGDADTPEAYFDFCAGRIRSTGGVVLRAGLSAAILPESVLRTMAPKSGGGDALLRRYTEQLKRDTPA